LTREFVAQTQRDRLIDAMAKTVAVKGYAAPLTEVCAAAGVSTRAFYEHFADKEECFMATFDRGVELLRAALNYEHAQPGRWPVRIRRGLYVLLNLLAAHHAFANLAIVEMLAAGPRARDRNRLLLEDFLRFFKDAPVRPGQPAVPLVAVEAIVAGVFGMLYNYVATQRTAELPDLLPELTFFVLAPFIGPSAAAAAGELPKPRRR
jgi:AcrR family transcriptional regulator